MTRTAMRIRMKTAVAAFAVLCAAAALALLATASVSGDRAPLGQTTEASPLEPSPLGR